MGKAKNLSQLVRPIGYDSTTNITTIKSGASDTTAVTIDASQNATFAGTITTGGNVLSSASGFKNRIINGAMVIDQRNNGATVTPLNGNFITDRWKARCSQASKYSVGQNTTVPANFKNSLLTTSLSAYAVLSGDLFTLEQVIEGFNTFDLNWGTSDAQAVTLSFWVRSSLTGTFGGSLSNSARNRSYPFTFSVSSANTFEYKTITVLGDTTGTWLADNGKGIELCFSLGSGSTYSGTAGAWASADYRSATGTVSVVGTSGATFYITGVQLEKGSVATGFDYRSYGTELGLCQRYFQTMGGAINNFGIQGYQNAGQGVSSTVPFSVAMRAAPTGVMPTFSNTNTSGAIINSTSSSCFLMVAVATILGSVSSINSTAGSATFSSEL